MAPNKSPKRTKKERNAESSIVADSDYIFYDSSSDSSKTSHQTSFQIEVSCGDEKTQLAFERINSIMRKVSARQKGGII